MRIKSSITLKLSIKCKNRNEYKFNFKFYHYVIVLMSFQLKRNFYMICLDTNCDINLINKQFLKQSRLNNLRKKIKKFIFLKNIDTIKDFIDNYFDLNMYIKDKSNDKNVVIHI